MKWLGAIAATIILLCSTGAWAAGPATLTTQTNNVNDPVNHPYSQTASASSCQSYYCILYFPALTANETLLQHVSCQFFLPTGVTASSLLVSTYSGDQNMLPVSAYANNGNGTYQATNESTYLFASSGDQYIIELGTNGGAAQGLYCTISGYHN